MRSSLLPLVLALLLLLLATPAVARTWVVPDDAPTIQAGIDSSSVGDTVLVEAGTYYECYVEPKSRTVLISETGEAGSVTIDAQKIRTVMRCYDLDSTTVIQGFILKNGGGNSFGGGIYASNSNPQIINCTIRNCRASQYGGGMYLTNSSPSLDNCMFYADTAGVYGGGLYATGTSSPYLYDCIFTANLGINAGGGIYAAGGSSPEFRVCSIELNMALQGGGGAVIDASQADFTFCYFRSNPIMNGNGAGMRCDNGSTVTLTGCTFNRHNGPVNGGAISTISSDLTIDGCTFHMNSAGTSGGGIYTNGSTVNVDNTIIAFGMNGGAVGCPGTPPTFTCSDIFGNVGGDWTGCIAGQGGADGNFSEDPRFCSRETANFTLRSCSPCIDAPGCGRVGAYGQGYCPRMWNVPADAPTIQAGIDSACGGDTVLVESGTYYEYEIVINDKSGLVLRSETGKADCVTIDATNGVGGGVLQCLTLDASTRIEGFTMTNGSRTYDAGAVYCNGADLVFENCVIAGNSCGQLGGGVLCSNSSPAFINCTISDNHTGWSWSGAVHIYNSYTTFDNTIIAFNTSGLAVYHSGSGGPTLTCCDVYGNTGGDWVGCIAGQYGVNGNISADPRFCSAEYGDFQLSSASACLYQTCGLIGALGRGCWDEIPHIESVLDVGNDQGRRVRLVWQRSGYDAGGDTVDVTGYGIYRRQDAHLVDMEARSGFMISEHDRAGAPLAQGWDYVGGVPARGDSIYQYVAPTLCDSTDDGMCWSVFMVSAETLGPLMYFDSDPDSGFSIDNLAPGPPPDLMMTSPAELAWEEVPDEDFDYYSVYGSDQPVLDEDANLIGYTIDVMKDVTGHVYDYYHVTATDFSGNEGEESSVSNTFAGIPGLPDARDIPTAFALRQNRPNPFGTSTLIAFDLPEATGARIKVYDTHGRIIKTLTNKNYEGGRHVVTWRGNDESGKMVSPGVYFIRMEAGEFEDMKKVMLLR
jgi:hypothetical protein